MSEKQTTRPTVRRAARIVAAGVITAAMGLIGVMSIADSGGGKTPPQFKVDPSWPKPLPEVKDADGNLHAWMTGEGGGVCVDSHDHIVTLNRGWQNSMLGKLIGFELLSGVPAPPVIIYDTEGNVVTTWGDATLVKPGGAAKVMTETFHGCFVDHEDNIWIGGVADGIVQKYSHDGKLLLQIGQKGLCDGPPTLSPDAFFPTCGSPGNNSSKTLLNMPADIAVDPNPDPVTKQRGSVYIADGYGNHRIVVFDAQGKYLRQWGSPGTEPGQFAATGGGHPHCVVLGKDGLAYVCDRGNNRIQVFDKLGAVKRIIPIEPAGFSKTLPVRTNDIEFSRDGEQSFMYTSDVSAGKIWILDRMQGSIVKGFGRMGHNAGEFVGIHVMASDSKGNIYTSEGGGGRRLQKFVRE